MKFQQEPKQYQKIDHKEMLWLLLDFLRDRALSIYQHIGINYDSWLPLASFFKDNTNCEQMNGMYFVYNKSMFYHES